jgi:TIR domain
MSANAFSHHLFISYAHIDNRSFSGGDRGWIDLLHERLEIRLAQLLGKPPKIWRDRKLKGYEVFDETIVIELSRSAILISIISPRYIESDYCRSEIENFFRAANQSGGVQLGDKRRVMRVVKTFVPLDEHPEGLRDLLPYEFYERNEASGRIYEFDHEISAHGDKDRRYWNKFEDLAWDLHELIKYLEDSDASSSPASGVTIYLAETTSDLIEVRDKVRRELAQYGHSILPDKALPLEATAFQTAVRDYLKRSSLSVHLIGEHYGVIPEMETERSVVRLQEELALERGDAADFSRLIWIPPGLQPRDERQRRFVLDLQNSFASHNGSELLQIKVEDLKTIIQAKLTQTPKHTAASSNGAGPVRIYLICDQQDADSAQPVATYLLDQGYEAILPLSEGTDAEILEDHKENLLMCDAVLIFQGRASESWLRMKLRELLKLPGYGRSAPLLAKGVYMGLPSTPLKERFNTLDACVIKNFGEFNPSSLDPFVAQIKKAKGGSQ